MTSPGGALRVLVVDDEAAIRLVIAAALDDFEVLQAGDGVTALEVLGREPVDLMLLDVGLPGVSGLDVLEHLRGREAFADLPVVLVTALGREADHVRGFEAGADAYVTKPFDFEEIIDVVRLVSSLSPERRREHRARELARAQTLESIESILG